MTIKEQIRLELEKGSKVNMSKLSSDSKISRGTLYKWLKGDRTEMGDGKIDRILSAMDMEAIIVRKRD